MDNRVKTLVALALSVVPAGLAAVTGLATPAAPAAPALPAAATGVAVPATPVAPDAPDGLAAPAAPAAATGPAALAASAAPGAQTALGPTFDIAGYLVEGNTLISQSELRAVLTPFIGQQKDYTAVEGAVGALRQAYQDRGYSAVAVALPEQELAHQVVRLKVVEGRIGNIRATGNRFFDQANILGSLPGLQRGQPPKLSAISRSIRLANDNPAKKISLQLAPGTDASVIDATVEVTDQRPWTTGITIDNTGDKQSGAARVGAFLSHANLLNSDHLLTLQYVTSPRRPGGVRIYGLGYAVPLYGRGASVDLVAAYSDVNSGSVAAAGMGLEVRGKGTVLGLHYNQYLPRLRSLEHRLVFGLDYRAYQNHVGLDGADLGNDVTVHPVSLTYAGALNSGRTATGFNLSLSRNLPGGWAGSDGRGDFRDVRAGAPVGYTLLRYGGQASYFAASGWQVRALLNGQLTGDALVPGEQYGLGGSGSVRGARSREFADDQGYCGTVEIYGPDVGRRWGMGSTQARALVFYDAGHLSRNHALPEEPSGTSLQSVGSGLRLTCGRRLSLAADWAILVDAVGSRSRGSSLVHLAATAAPF